MGHGTYRPALDNGITSPYAHLRQYVVSSTLKPDTDPAVTIVPGDPLALVRELKNEAGAGLDIWLCGGGQLAGTLLPEIDELLIKTYPVVAGTGIAVADGSFDPTVFDVAERTAMKSSGPSTGSRLSEPSPRAMTRGRTSSTGRSPSPRSGSGSDRELQKHRTPLGIPTAVARPVPGHLLGTH
jgi:dihydrofolate reductase